MVDSLLPIAFDGRLLKDSQLIEIFEATRTHLDSLPNCLILDGPITIVGDIHSQFSDLVSIFDLIGRPPDLNYLFLGDYVNRGPQPLEVVTLLILLMLRFPSRVHLLRGNHECSALCEAYGFYAQVDRLFPGNEHGPSDVYLAAQAVFNHLPFAAVVNDTFFCVHAGLSPSVPRFDEIAAIDRRKPIPNDGPLCDFVWSDPEELSDGQEWGLIPEGNGYFFGSAATEKFLLTHPSGRMKVLVRSHQLVMEGYSLMHEGRVLTIFSAPNYCQRCENRGAVVQVGEKTSEEQEGSTTCTVLSYSEAGSDDVRTFEFAIEGSGLRLLDDKKESEQEGEEGE